MAYFQHINDMGKCSQYNAVEKVGYYICSIDIKFKRKYIHRKKDHKILSGCRIRHDHISFLNAFFMTPKFSS